MTASPDWKAIRSDYENGLSLRELTAKHGVPKSVIGRQKYKEQWDQPQKRDSGTVGNTQGVINRDVNAAVKVAQAIQRRQSGWTYERIAADCGYASPGAARNAVQRELDRVVVQSTNAWRKDHTSRLEKQHEVVWPLAVPGPDLDPESGKKRKVSLFAHDRLIAISEREAKLLGLDAKPDIEQNANTPQVIVIDIPEGI